MTQVDEQHELERFEHLLERILDGDRLSAQEQAEYNALCADNPAFAQEAAILQELSCMDVHPSRESRALTEAVLEQLYADPSDQPNRSSTRVTAPPIPPTAREPHHAAPAPQPARSRPPRLVAICSLMAAAAAALLWVDWKAWSPDSSEQTRTELVFASGDVRVEFNRSALDPTPLRRSNNAHSIANASSGLHGRLLQQGEILAVGAGRACFVLDPQINICLDAHSRLNIEHVQGKKRRFVLEQGRVGVALDTQPQGYELTIVANGVESSAIGTVFTVSKDGADIHTSVLEGRVRVRHQPDGESATPAETYVAAHQRWTVQDATGTPRTRRLTLTRSHESTEWALVGATHLWAGHATGTLDIHPESGAPGDAPRYEIWIDDWLAGYAPLKTLAPVGRRHIIVRSPADEILNKVLTLRAGERSSLAFPAPSSSPQKASTPPPPPSPVPPKGPQQVRPDDIRPDDTRRPQKPSVTRLLDQARRFLEKRDFDQAIETYQRLRALHRDSAEARSALVAIAQLQLDHGHSPAVALQLLNRYLRAGDGAIAEEARYLRIRALARLKDTGRERQAIERFLQEHPNSFHVAELRSRQTALATTAKPPTVQP